MRMSVKSMFSKILIFELSRNFQNFQNVGIITVEVFKDEGDNWILCYIDGSSIRTKNNLPIPRKFY